MTDQDKNGKKPDDMTLREDVKTLPPGGTFKVSIPQHLKKDVPLEEEPVGLPLHKALEYLIENWREKERAGETPMRLRITEVFDMVYEDGQASMGYHPRLSAAQVEDLIEMDLEEVGSLESACEKARQYKTRQELLLATDLHDFLREF